MIYPDNMIREVRKYDKTRKVIASISAFLAVACLFSFVIYPALKSARNPESAGGPSIAKVEESGRLFASLDQSEVEIAGARIDVNPLNIEGEELLVSVARKDLIEDREEDITYVEYEIDVGGRHNFLAPIKVSLSYDNSLEKDGWAGIMYYSSEYAIWLPMETTIDKESGLAHTYLTSLSPVRMVYESRRSNQGNSVYFIRDEGHLDARFDVSHNYWQIIKGIPMTSAEEIAQEFLDNGNVANSMAQALEPSGVGSVNEVYSVFSTLTDVVTSPLPALRSAGLGLIGLDYLSGISQGIGIIGLAIAGVQMVSDCANYGVQDERTATNFMKNIVTNGSTLIGLFVGYTGAAVSLICAGLVVMAILVEEGREQEDIKKAAVTKSIFETYYGESGLGHIDDGEWFKIFSEAYYEAWQQGASIDIGYDMAMAKLNDKIEDHSQEFWRDIYKDGNETLTFTIGDAGERNFYTPSEKDKAVLVNEYKKDLNIRLQGTFSKWVNQFMLEKLQKSIYSSLWQLIKPYNDLYTVYVQEIAPIDSGASCRYQGYGIRFIYYDEGEGAGEFPLTEYPEEWVLEAPYDDDEWAVTIDFTLLGYIEAGLPNAVALFPPDEDMRDLSKAERIVNFALNPIQDGPTVVSLEEDDDFTGKYVGKIEAETVHMPSAMGSVDMSFSDIVCHVEADNTMSLEYTMETDYVFEFGGAVMTTHSTSQVREEGIPLIATEDGFKASFDKTISVYSSTTYSGEMYDEGGGSVDGEGPVDISVNLVLRMVVGEYGDKTPVISGISIHKASALNDYTGEMINDEIKFIFDYVPKVDE